MKPVILTALAALATSAIAAPTNNGGLLSGVENVAKPVTSIVTRDGQNGGNTGKLLSDIGPGVHTTLTVTGEDSQKLLIQLSPSVVKLLSGLGLPEVGVPVGQIVKKASSVGELLKDLSEPVENLLTVVSQDAGALLIKLSPEVKGLVAGLLPSLAEPVGEVVHTLGKSVKRHQNATGKTVQDLGPSVNEVLAVAGQDSKQLLIKLAPGVAGLLSGLGLTGLAGPVGEVVHHAASVGDLVKDLGPSVEGLLIVTGKDVGALLVKLAPSVAGLVAGLGLDTIATPVGGVLHVVGENL